MTKLKKVSLILSLVMTGITAFSLLITLLPHLLGMNMTVIKDTKMEPTYHKGSLLFVKSQPVSEIHVGDVITYYVDQGETIKTRRVVAKEQGRAAFYTKGDSQEQMEIGLVSSRNLVGQPVFHLPYLGFLASQQLVSLLMKIFWLFTGFLTFTTVWLLIEQLAREGVAFWYRQTKS